MDEQPFQTFENIYSLVSHQFDFERKFGLHNKLLHLTSSGFMAFCGYHFRNEFNFLKTGDSFEHII